MDDLALPPRPAPTAQRPLAGRTILLVEDSRFASEAIRLLALRSGARLRRADCLSSARRHLGAYRPDVAIVDLGLPDGSGLDLIRELSALQEARPAAVMATSGAPEMEAEALAAGADGFIAKPVGSLGAFQATLAARLGGPSGPRALPSDILSPDRLALAEDISRAGAMLRDGSARPRFVAEFLRGLAAVGGDGALREEVDRLQDAPDGALRDGLERLIAGREKRRSAI